MNGLIDTAVIGRGNVGGAALRQLADLGDRSPFRVVAVADSRGYAAAPAGFGPAELRAFADGAPLTEPLGGGDGLDARLRDIAPAMVLDLTAAPFGPRHRRWLEYGMKIATANKKPVTGPQEDFDALAARDDAYGFECACGAGLPVVSALRDLLRTGDELVEARFMPSGTLGFIFSRCAAGASFADAVAEAKRSGFTEPDPRDDLSGADVARKALVIARLAGRRAEFTDIRTAGLVPPALADVDADEFLRALPDHAADVDARFRDAASRGKTLRYLGTIDGDGVRVGIEEIAADDPFASLAGPENMFLFRTRRYADVPLIVRGPGAGAEVTAAGVLADAFRLVPTVPPGDPLPLSRFAPRRQRPMND